MRPTRLRGLLAWALVGLVLGGVVVASAYGDLPPLPRYAPVTLVLLAVVEVLMARVVRDRVQGLARRGARAVHPVQVARAAALAKASSPCGALLLGVYAGLRCGCCRARPTRPAATCSSAASARSPRSAWSWPRCCWSGPAARRTSPPTSLA